MTKTSAFACGIISLVGLFGARAVLADEAPIDSADRWALRQMSRVVARESERVPHPTLVGYYPTLRYYGKDYTINYGFVTLNRGVYRKLTQPNPMILPVEHPVQRDDARVLSSANAPHKASGPTFRATRKVSPADTESPSEAKTAAAAPTPAASASAAAAATIPLQPALPASAK